MQPLITFVCPVVRNDLVKEMLQSLYKFTDRSKFKLIIIDATVDGLGELEKVDMVIRMKNLGFAVNANTGLRVGLSWGTPYLGVINDDVRFIYSTWLEDALEEFKTDPNIIAVNPEAPKVPMWGYGLTDGEYVEILPYKEQYTSQEIDYLKKGDYDKEEISKRHLFIIPESFPFVKRGVVDAFAGFLPIFKREGLIETGLYDERFFPGAGEDYDWMGRAYSCAWPIPRNICDPRYHRRAVSTMKSWVIHLWGQSKDIVLDPKLFETREGWNHLDELWPDGMDVWGHKTLDNGIKIPYTRVKEVYIHGNFSKR